MAFPIHFMAFPIIGMVPGLAAVPGHGQVALGAKEVARGPHSGPPQGRASSFVPSATWPWPGAATRPYGNAQFLGTPRNWERHNNKWERHNIKWKRRGGEGLGGIWRYLVMKGRTQNT